MKFDKYKLKTLKLIAKYGELLISGDLKDKATQGRIKVLHADLRNGLPEVLTEFSQYMESFFVRNPARRYEVIGAFSKAEEESYPNEFLKENAKDSYFQRLMNFAGYSRIGCSITSDQLFDLAKVQALFQSKIENSDITSQAINEFKKQLPSIHKAIAKCSEIDIGLQQEYGTTKTQDKDGKIIYQGKNSQITIEAVKEGVKKKQNQSLSFLTHVKNLKYHTVDSGQGRESLQNFMDYFNGTETIPGITKYLSEEIGDHFSQIYRYLLVYKTCIGYLNKVSSAISDDNDIKKPIKDACDEVIAFLGYDQRFLEGKMRALGYDPNNVFDQKIEQIPAGEQEVKQNKSNPLLKLIIDLEKKQKDIVESQNSYNALGLSKDHFAKHQQKPAEQEQPVVSNAHVNVASAANNNANSVSKSIIAAKGPVFTKPQDDDFEKDFVMVEIDETKKTPSNSKS